MKIAGYWFFILGAIAAVVSFFLPTTVESYSSYSLGGGTLNLGLLQNQMMVLHVGLSGFLGGAVLVGCGEIAERLGPVARDSTVQPETAGEVQSPPEPLDGSIADGIAIKIVFGLIVVVLIVLLFIYMSNQPQTNTVGSTDVNSLTANLDAQADRLSAEADAIANSATP